MRSGVGDHMDHRRGQLVVGATHLNVSMMHDQTVSAVIPVHNGEAYIVDAIASALDQTLPVVECIVVDDGSTDGTASQVRRLGDSVRSVAQPHSGVSVARNRGAEIAQGQLVAFLDHDDLWLPMKLERQVAELEARGASMALCGVQVIDDRGQVRALKRLRPRVDLVTGMLMFDGTELVSCSSTGLVRREAFLASGGFDPSLSMSADWDLLLRTLLYGELAYVDEPLVSYRVHDSNMSHNIAAMERDMRLAFRKAFDDPRLPQAVRKHKRRAYARLYRMLAASYRDTGRRGLAARALLRAICYDPAIGVELMTGNRVRQA